MSRRHLLALAAVVAGAGLLRFSALGADSYWEDEWATLELVRLPFGDMLEGVREREATPPLYYALAWLWGKVLGYEPAALRSLSAVLGIATVPLAYLAARHLRGHRAGMVAAVLVATSPLLVFYSQEARSYALLVALAALSLVLLLRAVEAPTPGRLAAWAVGGALTVQTHHFGVFLLAPEAAWLLLAVARDRRRDVAIAGAGVALAAASGASLALGQEDRGAWIESNYPLGDRIGEVPAHLLAGFQAWEGWLWAPVLALLAVAVVAARDDREGWRRAALPGALGATAIALPLLLVALGSDYLITRNVIAAVVPLVVAVAVAVSGPRRRVLAAGALAGVAALWVAILLVARGDDGLRRPDWEAAERLLGPATAGRLVVVPGKHLGQMEPLIDSLPGVREVDDAEAVLTREIRVLSHAGPDGTGCWAGVACGLPGSRLVPRPSAPGFVEVAPRRSESLFTIVRLRSATARLVSAQQVARGSYVTPTTRVAAVVQFPTGR